MSTIRAAGNSAYLEETLAPLIDPRAADRLRRRLAREARRAATAAGATAP
jgi:PHD/YefM family antitoxin component YafN of YafNO toxin-antitoxin module